MSSPMIIISNHKHQTMPLNTVDKWQLKYTMVDAILMSLNHHTMTFHHARWIPYKFCHNGMDGSMWYNVKSMKINFTRHYCFPPPSDSEDQEEPHALILCWIGNYFFRLKLGISCRFGSGYLCLRLKVVIYIYIGFKSWGWPIHMVIRTSVAFYKTLS